VQDLYSTDGARSDVVDRSSACLMDHEERRMSDLSDFCWSVVSSVDNQINGDNQVKTCTFLLWKYLVLCNFISERTQFVLSI
jgi:hypothetical protein